MNHLCMLYCYTHKNILKITNRCFIANTERKAVFVLVLNLFKLLRNLQ